MGFSFNKDNLIHDSSLIFFTNDYTKAQDLCKELCNNVNSRLEMPLLKRTSKKGEVEYLGKYNKSSRVMVFFIDRVNQKGEEKAFRKYTDQPEAQIGESLGIPRRYMVTYINE